MKRATREDNASAHRRRLTRDSAQLCRFCRHQFSCLKRLLGGVPNDGEEYDLDLDGAGTNWQQEAQYHEMHAEIEVDMGFLKRFFRNVLHEEMQSVRTSSFEHLSEEELEAHLGVARYGNFELTDAVRPSYDLRVIPSQGFRHDTYRDEDNQTQVPVLMASASRYELFEIFMDLLDPLGPEVDVVLETSHDQAGRGHADLYREHIDMPVLKSILWEYEDMLLNDGCTGIAILNPATPQEVQFDEHKMLIVYGQPLGAFEATFRERNLPCQDEMKFITEAEHVHSSSDQYARSFEELKVNLGMDGSYA